MGFHKDSAFSADEVRVAAFARALAHPARVAIIGHLRERGEATCGEIVALLPLAQATVSQHLGELRRAGVLEARECGTRVCYSVRVEELRTLCDHFRCSMEGNPVEKEKAPL